MLLDRLHAEYSKATITPMGVTGDGQFERWVDAIKRHLAGTQPHLELPLDIRATAFQMLVWKYLQSIPYGDLQSYGEIAAAIVTRPRREPSRTRVHSIRPRSSFHAIA